MPLANQCGLIASLLQQFRKRWLTAVKTITISIEAVRVTVFAGQNASSAGTANRVGHIASSEPHAVVRKSVDVWRRGQFRTVGAYRLA
jgi:hypothetical protein